MTNVQIFESKESILQQACCWVSRIDRGLTNDEQQQLQDWVASSDAHRRKLIEIASLYDDLSVLNELSGMFPLRPKSEKLGWMQRLTLKSVAIAASFAMLFVSTFMLSHVWQYSADDNKVIAKKSNEFRTFVGEQRTITLPDGSIVKLNTDSVITYHFSDHKRQIELHRGEAYFDVAHDTTRPFSVKANESTVTAVGTAFNVEFLPQKAFELLVTEGKVKLERAIDPNGLSPTTQMLHKHAESAILLEAGKRALIFQDDINSESVSPDQIEKSLAWHDGMLEFTGESLEDVLKEVSRYTTVQFALDDGQLNQVKVAGLFKTGDIQGLLVTLRNNFNIEHTATDSQMIQLRRAL